MRKFTKGLLMTLVASAMSVGAFAQVQGYYRVVNLGYYFDSQMTQGVVNVSDVTTAKPDADPAEALFMPGTVMYIDATPMSENPETTAQYVDVFESDLIVNNLRSQAVDASSAFWGELGANMKKAFTKVIDGFNGLEWKGVFTKEEQEEIIDQMFYYMQMFLEEAPAEFDGFKIDTPCYRLKSTTPNVDVLLKALEEKGIEGWDYNKLWGTMWEATDKYFEDNEMNQARAQWVYFKDTSRIHLGHTYYLIGGIVDTNLKDYQEHKPAGISGSETPFISLANNNKYYGNGLRPEIEVADLYSIWTLVPVQAESDPDAGIPENFFAVKNGVQGLDGHYYTTGYFDFPFEYDTNDVAVYGINEVFAPKAFESTVPANELVAYVLPAECGGKAPAKTPVVIENKNKSADYAILQPVDQPADQGEASVMKGIFFDETFDETSAEGAVDGDSFEYFEFPTDKIRQPFERIVKEEVMIARENVRVFNKTDNALHVNNPLGFFKYDGKTIKANKGWIDMTDIIPTAPEEAQVAANVVIVDAATFAALTDGITEIAPAKSSTNVVYDIQGRIVTNPTKGLYIVNGKKVIK